MRVDASSDAGRVPSNAPLHSAASSGLVRRVRHTRRSARAWINSSLALATAVATTVALAGTLSTPAAAATTQVLNVAHAVHHAATIGDIITPNPEVCTPGSPGTPPAPSLNTLAWIAEPTLNQVQSINEQTGATVGSPIAVGTTPEGVGYWRPAPSTNQDPDVIVANSANHSVTVIDAVSRSVLSSVNLPAGAGATSVAGSPSNHYAVVVDPGLGKVSIINPSAGTDAGEISLTGTAAVLSSVAFSASGAYAYVTDPSQHEIFVLKYTGGSAPYYTEQTTYSNSSYNPTGIATDLSTSSSSTLIVGNAQASSGSLLSFSDSSGTLSAPTVVKTFSSTVPGAISLTPGGTNALVAMTGTKTVNQVVVSSGTTTTYSLPSTFTSVGPIALSADGSTLMAADTGSAKVQELSAATGSLTNSTAPAAVVSSIAPALATQGSWNAYVATSGNTVDVVNSSTQSVTQTITDANGPQQVATSPDGQYVYVANTSSVSIIQTSLIGTTTNPIVATITGIQGSEPTTPDLNGISVSPSGNAVLVADSANGAVDVIDTNSADGASYRTVVERYGLAGSGISSSLTPQGGIAFSPDGLFAYVTEASTTNSNDGVAVLSLASATTTGYTYLALDHALTEDSLTMIAPSQITINPNGESAYVTGTDAGSTPQGALWTFPIGTNGQLANGSTTVSPVWLGGAVDGVAYSPEDDSAFVSSTASFRLSSVSETYSDVNYNTATDGWPGAVAVSPDGLYVAELNSNFCAEGVNSIGLFNAGSGTNIANIALASAPLAVAIAPQSSPQVPATSELAGGASNPSEAAVSSAMNDVVSSGTPSDAPGASAGVDTATGAYSLSLDSLDVPDLGINLSQTATYDSGRAATSGLLGYGWDYSYGITATQNAYNAATNPCAIVVTQEDGATVTFFPSAQGPYSSCPTSDYEAPGWAQATISFATSCNGSDSCYVVTRDGTESFSIDETTGQLVKEVDLHGNAVTIAWGTHGSTCTGATSTEPCQVTAADGIRPLTFSYPSAGSGTCPSSATSCVVVTDPLGRTVTYAKNSSGQLASVTLANGTQSASYAFTYASGNLLASWWDPQNNAAYAGNTAYATDVTYTSSKVTQVTGPTMTNAGTSMTSTYVPKTTFAYTCFNSTTGNGTVEITNPNFNQSTSMYGANLSLDTYSDFELVSSLQGYGPSGDYASALLAPTPSESAVPMRDTFNLMPEESMNALAGAWVGPVSTGQPTEYDAGVTMTTYDANGNVLSSVDPSGDTTTNQYNGLNEVTISVDAIGNTAGASSTVVAAHTTTNTYDAAGDLLTTTSPATEDWTSNPQTSSYYNANGTVCATRTADEVATYGVLSSCASSHATTFAYDSSGDQTKKTDPLGDITESAFAADGNGCATLSPDGYVAGDSLTSCPSTGEPYESVTLAWNLYLHPTQSLSPTNAPGGTTWTYLNLNNDQIASVGVLGNPSTCNPLTVSTCAYTSYAAYDAMGDAVSSTTQTETSGTAGPTATTFFDPDGNSVASVSPAGNTSGSPATYEQATVVNNLGSTAATTMASNLGSGTCSVTSTSLPCPNTQVTTYDPLSEATGAVTAKGGEPGSSVVATTSTYNPNSTGANATAPSVSDGLATTANAYDANGNQLEATTTTNPATSTTGTTTTYEPNGATCWSSPLPWTAGGTPSCDSPPTGSGTMTTVDYYDSSGQLVAVSGPGSNPYATGNSGGCNPLTTAACGFTTYYTFDEGGHQLTAVQPSDYLGHYPTTTTYYDASGNEVAVTGAAGTPGTCNPIVTSTCADTKYSTFDADGRVDQVSYTDGTPTVTYTYNNDGTRHQMTDGTGTTSYSYDLLGQLTSKTDGASNAETYGYSSSGQLICMSYPNTSADTCATSGAGTSSPPSGDITYVYNSLGQLSSIATWTGVTLTYAYDCAGNVAWLSTGTTSGTPCTGSTPVPLAIPPASSAVTTQYNYVAGQETSIATSTSAAATNLLSFTFTRDAIGNILTSLPKTDSTTLATDTYTYDSASRVASGPIVGTGSNTYAYTAADGITAATANFQSAPYSQSGELCWTINSTSSNGCGSPPTGATTYSYDPSGDRLSVTPSTGNAESLGWEQSSERLICANTAGTTCSTSSPTTSTTLYSYNGDGLRSSSTYQSATTTFVWDGLQQRLLSNGASDYIYGIDPTTPILQITADGSTPVVDLLCQDANHDTRGIVQLAGGTGADTGTLVAYVDYDAFGNPITQSGGAAVAGGLTAETAGYAFSRAAIGFGTGYLDSAGLDYLVNRFYDPASGQFVSVDQEVESTETPYTYANENPTNGYDPSGHWSCTSKTDDPHDSHHQTGRVNVEATTNCNIPVQTIALQVSLYKTAAFGFGYFQSSSGLKVVHNRKNFSVNAAETCTGNTETEWFGIMTNEYVVDNGQKIYGFGEGISSTKKLNCST